MLAVICMALCPDGLSAQAATIPELAEQARSAGIEQSRVENLQNRARARGVQEDELAGILRSAVSMAENDLPYDLILDKALEGISKGVSGQQMMPLLSDIERRSGEAAQFVDQWVDRPEVEHMLSGESGRMGRDQFRREMIKVSSKTLLQGFDAETLEQTLNSIADEGVTEQARPSGILAAVNILGDLPEAAGKSAENAGIVVQALKGGFNATDLQKLPGAMNMAQRRSQLPASAVAEGMSRQLSGGLPASEILQNLFNGNIGGGPPGNLPPGADRDRPPRGGGPPQ